MLAHVSACTKHTHTHIHYTRAGLQFTIAALSCSIMHRKSFIFSLHMHYTLQRRTDDEGIVTGLYQGCSLTLVVSASLVLIYAAGRPSEPTLLYSVYSAEGLQTE